MAFFPECDIGTLTNYSNFKKKTNFTLAEFDEYVKDYSYYQCYWVPSWQRPGFLSFVVSGIIGMISYGFMLAALKHMTINACTLIYHKATAVLEMIHMAVMIEVGLIQLYKPQIPTSWSFQFWYSNFNNGWAFGDTAKLAVATLGAFVSVEGFVAVCMPFAFKKLSRKWIAYSAVAASLLIGSAHLWVLGANQVAFNEKSKKFYSLDTAFSDSGFYAFITNFIYAVKIGVSVMIFCLCSATAIRLRWVMDKLRTMNTTSKKEWSDKRKACVLAYVLGISVLIDHAVWAGYLIYKRSFDDDHVGEKAVKTMTYSDAMADLQPRKILPVMELLQRLIGEFVHCWRFFLYLAFNQSIRNGLVRVFRESDTASITAGVSGPSGSNKSQVRMYKRNSVRALEIMGPITA